MNKFSVFAACLIAFGFSAGIKSASAADGACIELCSIEFQDCISQGTSYKAYCVRALAQCKSEC